MGACAGKAMRTSANLLKLDEAQLRAGMRLGVGLSGGADSVALLRALAARNREKGRELGVVLHAAHLHHGLRGAEADADLEFCRNLAASLDIPFHTTNVDTTAEAKGDAAANKGAETVEEAARRLRYAWFRQLMREAPLDAVATAHTLDDQAETVLAKFLRGAWTEGFSGIHPVLTHAEGRIVRPLLGTTRVEVEIYLRTLNQPWREDSTNRHLTYTRNRIRHELLPQLERWNPRLREHLAQMGALARDEEAWWQAEMDRLAPQLVLPGKPVRGGGRTASEGLAIDVTRLLTLPIALQRRLLRHAAEQVRAAPDFEGTEALRELALSGRAGQKLELAAGLRAERTHRELRLSAGSIAQTTAAEYTIPIPGGVDAPAFGVHLRIEADAAGLAANALLRSWRPGDRVRVRHSGGTRKVKEVLERMKVTGSDRAQWPVLEVGGRIVWMRGIELEPEVGIRVAVSPL